MNYTKDAVWNEGYNRQKSCRLDRGNAVEAWNFG